MFYIIAALAFLAPAIGSHEIAIPFLLIALIQFGLSVSTSGTGRTLRILPTDVCVAVLVFFGIVSTWMYADQPDRRPFLIDIIALGAFYYSIARAKARPSDFTKIGYGYIFGAAATGLVVIASYMTGRYDEAGRATAFGQNANYVSYSISAAVPIVYFLAEIGSRKKLLLACLPVYFLAILMAGTRASLLAVVLCTVVYMARKVFSKHFPLALAGTLIILASSPFYVDFLPNSIATRLTGVNYSHIDDLAYTRYDQYLLAGDLLEHGGVFGGGPYAFTNFSQNHLKMHNVFGSTAVEWGVTAAIAYVLIFVFGTWRFVRAGVVPRARMAWLLYLCIIVPTTLTGAWATAAPLWITLGWMLRLTSFRAVGRSRVDASIRQPIRSGSRLVT